MQNYDHLGQVFKNLRTNRHISLKQISNERVSAAQISRFERGESDISLEKFLIALSNMHIEVSEFMDAVNNYQRTELQSFICKCDATVPFPEEYIDEVTDYLFTTEEWNMYELILIGNLYLFIDIPLLHRMGQEILKRKDYYWEIGSHKNLVTITLLNIWETCLHRDALTVALFYMEKIEPLLNDETDLYKRTIYLFLSGLLHYKQGEKQFGIEEMKNAIQIFEWVGSENLANNYKKDFERFVR